jgi:probable F420-dependent oxidoreductase
VDGIAPDRARRFRFAVQLRGSAEWPALRKEARRLERLGYDTLTVPDHVVPELLPPWTALTALALATKSARVGTLVLANDLRHPVMTARDAAAVDALSGGRLELGIGAGWLTRDYRAVGVPFDPPGTRVERLTEAVGVMKRLWQEEEVSHRGKHYAFEGAVAWPKPARRPHPTLLIAGGGRRILSLAAREADVVAVVPGSLPDRMRTDDMSAEAADQKVAWVRAAAGDRFERIELNTLIFELAVTDQPERHFAQIAERMQVEPSVLRHSPFFLVGRLDELRRQLVERRERFGFSYFTVRGPHVAAFAPLARELAAAT